MPFTILKTRLKTVLSRLKDGRAQRRRKIAALIARLLPFIRVILLVIGYAWFLVLPYPRLGRRTYIDENALQPGQVTTSWNWADVHRADQYLEQLERLRDTNASGLERARFLETEFKKVGLASATQAYSISAPHATIHGVNAYAVLSAPRASGTEAMILSASWRSRTGEGNGTLNLRGLATVLALATFLKTEYSLWAKDIVFVIGDGYLDGMHAFLSAYHDAHQSNLDAEPLAHTSGVVWTALNIDYPAHSFSHLGVFYEGLNGRLPNQDLYNSFQVISRHTGGVPVVLYDHLASQDNTNRDERLKETPSWLPLAVRTHPDVLEYFVRAKNIARQAQYQAFGRGSGVHGLYHRYRIDAITLFGVPAEGPHGFHSIGKVIESTFRTMNNLLERLHASFFFYILTTPTSFLKIGHYLPAAILLSVSLLFGGLQEWSNAGWRHVVSEYEDKKVAQGATWETRNRPVLPALLIMLSTHVVGAIAFVFLSQSPLIEVLVLVRHSSWLTIGAAVLLGLAMLFAISHFLQRSFTKTFMTASSNTAPLSTVLKAFNMYLASALISVTSVLNFSLAALLAILLGYPLTLSAPRGSSLSRTLRCTAFLAYAALGYTVFVSADALWFWTVLGVWFAPLTCTVYVPLLIQAALACILPS